MGKHYVRVDKGGGDHRVRWAFLRQVDEIFNPGDYLLVLLGVDFLQLLLTGQFSSCPQITYEPPIVIDVVITMPKKLGMGEHQVLSVTKEH